jgi:hypothetical protein
MERDGRATNIAVIREKATETRAKSLTYKVHRNNSRRGGLYGANRQQGAPEVRKENYPHWSVFITNILSIDGVA